MVDRGNIENGSGAELGGARFTEKKLTAIECTYAVVRSRIVEGVYPPGSKLHLETLKSSFGISGSTLREALTRLMADRLVLTEGQKGFRVTPMSLSDLEDLTDARIKLETSALAESIKLGDDAWEDNLVTCFHRLARAQERLEADPAVSFDAWEVRNKEFHEALAAASPSAWLARFRRVLFQSSERYRRLSGTMGPIPFEVHNEHEEIFKAAMARDTDKAVSALAEHIRRSVNVIRAKALHPD
ncbi:GntR family transcriptional regulator [Azospirillum rugosum]|uniref:DNA-binding GntR family transcriptional regulator n=1 Tax=Azospirillum rugosum TaxID=416170 RepID=A0ABS4SX56_9PROT|nr:FCD domain-containing protein [Azospirillum rugosum]MBP2297148.1 DNA-binding GntR family transcriptional regulator [Azospirillum rugosum]MDQ0530946.1 DNA-binding GntR family transcriptional regulator [Azospirillum rugosum]